MQASFAPRIPAPPASPIVPPVWENPKGKAYFGFLYNFTSVSFNLPAPPAAQAFSNTDWTLPTRRGWQDSGFRSFNAAIVTAATPTQPFSQTDWPNPARPARPADLLPALNLLNTTLAVAPADQPFQQIDWPNPRTAARLPFGHASAGLLQTTLAPVGAAPPVRPVFWQNPVRAPIQPQSFQRDNITLNKLNFPFRQRDWPNPLIARQPQQPARVFNLLPRLRPLFQQNPLSNPITAQYPYHLLTWAFGRPLASWVLPEGSMYCGHADVDGPASAGATLPSGMAAGAATLGGLASGGASLGSAMLAGVASLPGQQSATVAYPHGDPCDN